MNIDLSGKTALVCGSTAGIGKAIAIQFAQCGASVILMARNTLKMEGVLQMLDVSNGQNHRMTEADFSDNGSVFQACSQLGSEQIDILVNNTGGPAAGKAVDASADAFMDAFCAHLINFHNLVKTVVPGMKERGSGRIINIISTSVKVPLPNLGVSNTIRGAVGNWSKTLANELAPFGITVNNILPGATETERLSSIIDGKSHKLQVDREEIEQEMLSEIPMNRFGKPEEPAYAAAFLASGFASYITGTNIVVDGGRTPCL